MLAYRIFYYAPADVQVDDVVIANSSIEAIKKFVMKTKGKYNVAFATPIETPKAQQVEELKQLLGKTILTHQQGLY